MDIMFFFYVTNTISSMYFMHQHIYAVGEREGNVGPIDVC